MATNQQLLTLINALTARVVTLENRPVGGGTDFTPAINALDARLDVLEVKTCVEQPRFVTIEGKVAALEAKSASEEAAQNILEADHVPLP